MLKDQKSLHQLPNSDIHNCFGCSPVNPTGLRMTFFTEPETAVKADQETGAQLVYSWVTVPEHLCGWSTVVHGGVVATILDEIMSWTAIHLLKKLTLTKTMTIDYPKAAQIGEELRAEGRVLQMSGKREADFEGAIYDPKGDLCARSTATFTLLSPKLAKRIGIITETEISKFFGPMMGIS